MTESCDVDISMPEEIPLINEVTEKRGSADDADAVTIVLAGKSGVGKSTLFQTLLGLKTEISFSAKRGTAEHYTLNKNNVRINIIDTSCLVDADVKSTSKKYDLLVYCVIVSPGSRFRDANPDVMRRLQKMYGREIWKHSVFVFTFSNVAWERSRKGHSEEKGTENYKQYIEEYVRAVEEELTKLQVKDLSIESIFSRAPDHTPNPNTILVIPAGYKSEDQILPGVTLQQDSTSWMDEIYIEMMKKSKCNDKLAQYRDGWASEMQQICDGGIGMEGTVEANTDATAGKAQATAEDFWILCWRCCCRSRRSGGGWQVNNFLK